MIVKISAARSKKITAASRRKINKGKGKAKIKTAKRWPLRVAEQKKLGLAGMKREVLFAPWRHTYIKRTLIEEKGCPFCDAVKRGVSLHTLIVFNGKTCSVILNKFPYNNGHAMIIPKRHTAEFDKLDPQEFRELHELLRKTFDALKQIYEPQGMNIGMNLGRVGGAGIVDHLHYHLVPRWGGDTNFMPIIGQTKVISESLEETYNKLIPFFI